MWLIFAIACSGVILAGCDVSSGGGTWTILQAGADDANGVHTYRVWELNNRTGEIRLCSYASGDAMGVTCSNLSNKP